MIFASMKIYMNQVKRKVNIFFMVFPPELNNLCFTYLALQSQILDPSKFYW